MAARRNTVARAQPMRHLYRDRQKSADVKR